MSQTCPVIAIVGRPNVGKSTLFNRLTRSRQAIVADWPGVTRDRQYGEANFDGKPYLVIDTGGVGEVEGVLENMTQDQARLAMNDADIILLIVDGRAGCTPVDEELVQLLRREYSHKKAVLCVNKSDRLLAEEVCADFFHLGFGEPQAIASETGRGIEDVLEQVLPPMFAQFEKQQPEIDENRLSFAVVGRPNVGKSTLINRLLGEERVIVLDRPGTTIDSIAVPCEYQGVAFTLIDTAGVRRQSRVKEKVEQFSVIKAMQAMRMADVTCLVLDAQRGISEQDQKILGLAVKYSAGILIAINKWDHLPPEQREKVLSEVDRRLGFIDFARHHTISALHGTGCGDLLQMSQKIREAAQQELTTSHLTRTLEQAVETHQPPLMRGRRIRLRVAHLGGRRPLTIIVHGKQCEDLPDSYRRYLANFFRKRFRLHGVPVHVTCKSDDNPYKKDDKR